MLSTLKKTLVAGAVLAVSAASAQAWTVSFNQPHMGFGAGPIVVESTDGKTWSHIKSTKLTIPYSALVKYTSGDDGHYRTHTLLQGGTKLFQALDNSIGTPSNYSINNTAYGSTDNFTTIVKMNVRDACNKRLATPGAINKDQNLFINVPVSLVAEFVRKNMSTFTKTTYGHSKIAVVCKGVKPAKPEPVNISKVRFQAYAESGTSCPRYRTVRLRLEGTKGGTADVVVMRDDGKKIERTVPITKPNGHQFFVLESTRVKKSETRKYYLVVKGTKISVGWNTVDIKCAKPPKPGAGDKQTETKPDTAKPKPGKIISKRPKVPGKTTVPPKRKRPTTRVGGLKTPPLVCIGGKVKRNTCLCKPTYKKLKIGAHAYRCVRVVTNKTLKRAKPARKQQVSTPAQQQNRPLLKLLKKKR